MNDSPRAPQKPEKTRTIGRPTCRPLLYPVLLVLIGFATWGFTAGHDFVWDDDYFVVRNPALRAWSYLPRYFTDVETMAGAGRGEQFSVFRPLRNISYRIDFVLFGLRPAGWHLHNVLLHTFNACLLFFVATRMGLKSGFAFVAGLVFLLHPLQSEVVCWVKGRDDLLAAFFSLGALLVWLGPRPSPRRPFRLAALAVLYAAACLSKIQVVVLPALFLAQEVLLPGCRAEKRFPISEEGATGGKTSGARMSARDAVVVFALLGLVGIGILWWRHAFLARAPNTGFSGGDFRGTFLTAIRAAANYLALFLFPKRLLADYSGMEISRSFADARVWASLAALLALAAGALLARRRFPAAVCGVAWSALLILPVLNVVPMQVTQSALHEPMAERLCYAPMIGLAVAAAALAQAAGKRWRRGAPVVAALLLIAAAGRSVDRARDWKDKITLYSVTVRDTPSSALRPRNNLLTTLINAQRYDAALPLARRMWETLGDRASIAPRKRAEIARHLAFLLGRTGKSAESRALLERALELDPSYPLPYIDMGIAAGQTGDHGKALEWFDKAVAAAPWDDMAHFNRAVALESLGRAAEAETSYRKVLELGPPAPEARAALSALAALLWKQGRFKEAEKVYATAVRLWPSDKELQHWLREARNKLKSRE